VKQIFIGTYEFGYSWVRLYLREGTGADGDCFPKDKGIQTFHIGADKKRWRDILANLLHEAQEACMHELGFAYNHNRQINNSSADFLFVLTHEQFNECCCRAGELIALCQSDLHTAWKKWQTDAKKPVVKRIRKGKKHHK